MLHAKASRWLQERGLGDRSEPERSGKPGATRHAPTDAKSIPVASRRTGADVPDSRMSEGSRGPFRQCRDRRRKRRSKRHADKVNDQRRCRRALPRRRIQHRIARRRIESSSRLGRHRWVLEWTLAWFAVSRLRHPLRVPGRRPGLLTISQVPPAGHARAQHEQDAGQRRAVGGSRTPAHQLGWCA
jgi:hypothetical protein